jgi:hypothetical protein
MTADFFKFEKRSQLFIRAHNERLSIAAVCINNPKRSLFVIHSCDTPPTPSGFAEIVRNYFPVTFHAPNREETVQQTGREERVPWQHVAVV